VEKIPRHKLKSLYSEIVRGYSISSLDFLNKDIYVKHFSTLDSAFIDLYYQEIYDDAISKKIPTRLERENYIIREKFWTEEKERKIAEFKYFIQGLNKTKEKLFRENDLNQIKKQIKETEQKIYNLELEKEQYIGLTAEDFAAKKTNEFFIFKSFFNNSSFTEPLFSEEIFDDLETSELNELLKIYSTKISPINNLNLQRIALSPFFLNVFYLCQDNLFDLWGKPILHLTFYQSELSAHARYFKSILSEIKQEVSEELLDNPEKLIELYTGRKNANALLEQNQGKAGVSFVNASKKDFKNLGITQDTGGKDVFQEMSKMGKKRLTSEEFQKISN